MASTTTYSSTQETYPSLYSACQDAPLVPVPGWEETSDVKREWSSKLDPESRPMPSQLWRSPTSRALQYTRTDYAGTVKWERDIENSCYVLYEGNVGTVHRTEVARPFYSGSDSSVPGYPDPDWITPLRQQINSLKVNLGQDLAEYRQTVDLYNETSSQIVAAKQHYKKKKRSRKRGSINLCHMAAADIIYGFGIAPLIGTLFDSYIALNSKLEAPTKIRLVQSAKEDVSYQWSNANCEQNGRKSTSTQAKVYLTFQRGLSLFTMGNPVSVAWELVPYSFLFDYMIPVGNYLSALDAMVGVQEVVGTVTTRRQFFCSETSKVDASHIATNTPALVHYKDIKRDVLTSIPLPPFPKWEPSASWHKLRHAVALLYQNRSC